MYTFELLLEILEVLALVLQFAIFGNKLSIDISTKNVNTYFFMSNNI